MSQEPLEGTNDLIHMKSSGFPGDSDSKESACNIGDWGSTPGLGRYPGEENGSPLQYSFFFFFFYLAKTFYRTSQFLHIIKNSKWSCSVMSNSLRPHGLYPTRLLHPWDFPGKNSGVGCHFLLHRQYSCLENPMDRVTVQRVTKSWTRLSD